MEEVFFFHYHMHMRREDYMCLPVFERKWLQHRFIEQKNKENEALEKAKKAKK